ncbi:UDP-N-acetylmuramoyl-L-alanine--D-glutamate ligase [Candidatus Peregrinibacteria bacterium HGW-Peregrinibacteria-1]|jgi:UDP-N-acetylmuramoylalanine--D-glutamate ligase|nr:MAG: UDP-N-acetylmuramoyl-L-alanine--D-glutamate ligase [Candidatus Peregrinibacteria bacterium HGW-Peregrinibacteria-1]
MLTKESKIAILGYGLEGVAMLNWLVSKHYGNVTVCDASVDIEDRMPNGVSVRLGENYLKDLGDFDVIFRSPGVKFLEPEIQKAVNRGVVVTSVTAFFVDHCPCPIIGVTGTKGKGTTSTLIYEILKKAGRSVYLGGNIGLPAIEFLDDLKGDDLVVLELSSFQLQDMKKSPKFGVFLNTTEDHLDYHEDRGEYLRAKESLLMHQNENGVAVLNDDYEYVNYYKKLVKGALKLVSMEHEVADGAFVRDEAVWYAKDGEMERVVEVADIGLVGRHNLENVMPAVVITKELGVENSVINEAVVAFKGLPHRLEFVREVDGVRYFNDSFSTTPETSVAAVDAFDEDMVLIAGGFDKGLDYKNWALKILLDKSLRAVVLVGDTTEKMQNEIEDAKERLGDALGSATLVMTADDLKEAIDKAREFLKKGVIVMSPGSSSFDLYSSYKERGERFREVVKGL